MKTICIYHGNCYDGICAAWVISRMFPHAIFIPANYGDTKLITNLQQDCYENANINTHYILVDFSLPRELMIQMHNKAESILVLDHHKTAQKDCEGLEFCVFNMAESGASLAWKYYFPREPIPYLINYIKDRDLWLKSVPFTEEVNSYIQSFPMTITDYEHLYVELESKGGIQRAVEGGHSINRYKMELTNRLVQNRRIMNVGGYDVPVVNTPVLMSEVGHALAELGIGPFGAYYFDRGDGIRQWGARSIGNFDVSEIAKNYGGGGHKNAAGWQE